jgi:hypothetical protein
MNRWFAIAAALVLAVLIGVAAYNFGVQQGLAQSGKIVAAQPAPYSYPYYGHPWGFGFFPIFPFLFFLFVFLMFRGVFWRRGWYRHQCENNPDRR